MNIIEWFLGALIELTSFSVPDLLFGLPRMRLNRKITKKANSLSLSARKLNELAKSLNIRLQIAVQVVSIFRGVPIMN